MADEAGVTKPVGDKSKETPDQIPDGNPNKGNGAGTEPKEPEPMSR